MLELSNSDEFESKTDELVSNVRNKKICALSLEGCTKGDIT